MTFILHWAKCQLESIMDWHHCNVQQSDVDWLISLLQNSYSIDDIYDDITTLDVKTRDDIVNDIEKHYDWM